jgi:hypothetical protein
MISMPLNYLIFRGRAIVGIVVLLVVFTPIASSFVYKRTTSIHSFEITRHFHPSNVQFTPFLVRRFARELDSSTSRLLVGRKTMEERNLTTATTCQNSRVCLVDFGNFWRKTHANFTACERPSHEPSFTSKSGSAYWDFGDEVIRYSNHWTGQHGVSKIVDCYWTINVEHEKKEFICGKCQYIDFLSRKKQNTRSNTKPKGFKR